MSITDAQRLRKNEMAKLNRARKKELKEPEVKSEDEEIIEVDVKEEPENIVEVVEDPEIVRKKAIADKRRISLALARSKIRNRNVVKQEKDDELTKVKEENERLKELAKKEKEIPVIQEVVKKKVARVAPVPVRQRPKKQEVYQQPPTIDYLTHQSYAEQLQIRLRNNMHHQMMQDTFM
jgi:hypothetical protein